MTSTPYYFLQSSRLGFRRWKESDLPLARDLWGDPLVTRFIHAGGRMAPEEVEERLNEEIELAQADGLQYWPVFLLDTGTHIGCAGLKPFDEDGEIAEIGIHLKPAFWRNGYAEEAASALITFAFGQLKFKALFAGHHPENKASAHLLEKLEFKLIGEHFYPPTGLQHKAYLLTAGLPEVNDPEESE